MQRKNLILLCNFFILILTGCTVGPDYNKPAVDIPRNFKESNKNWKIAEPNDQVDKGKWWNIFHNKELNSLEEKVNISNQNIAQAEAQYKQAKALVSEAQAGYFPTLGASGSYSRQSTAGSHPENNYSVSGQASWEPDVWGSVRRSVESGQASKQASAANLASIKLVQQALLAQNYIQLRVLDSNQKLLDETVLKYNNTLKLIQKMFRAGTSALSVVLAAQNQLQSAQAEALDNKISRAQLEHAIAVLIGLSPSDFSLSMKEVYFEIPDIPKLLPSQLLERRPDVAQAERLAAQANAEIGVSVAAYFPSLTLGGAGGYQSAIQSALFTAPSLFWSLGPTLAATLFDGGLRAAKIDAAKANYQASVANYRQTVLSAFQNVEDNLAALNILKQEITIQQESYLNTKHTEELIMHQYKAGISSYIQLIAAQANTFTAAKALNDLKARSLVSAVNLIKALGGGWDKVADEKFNASSYFFSLSKKTF